MTISLFKKNSRAAKKSTPGFLQNCPHPEEKRETRITGGSVTVEETEDTCTQCGKTFEKRFET